MLQGDNQAVAEYAPENMEKVRAEMVANAKREQRMRCLELVCRTHSHESADEHIIAAKKFYEFINA